MGQYFMAVCLDTMQVVRPIDYHETAKLTETSWIGNEYVGAVEKLLGPYGLWNGHRIVWAGDYMDGGKFMDEFEHDLVKDENGNAITTLYNFANTCFEHVKNISAYNPGSGYLVNLDKKQFIQMDGCPKDSDDMQLNPLPLLSCASNGQNGGDYFGKAGAEFVGSWCGDRLAIEIEAPEGFEEIQPKFIED